MDPFQWQPHVIEPGPSMLDFLDAIAHGKEPVAFDVETQGDDPYHAKIMCLSLATTQFGVSVPWLSYFNKRAGDVPGLSTYSTGAKIERLVKQILASPKIPKTAHNGAYDLAALAAHGCGVRGFDFDTILAHATVSPPLKHGLDTVACIYLAAERWKQNFRALKDEKGADRFANADPLVLREYNCKDSLSVALIRPQLEDELDLLHNGWDLYHGLEAQSTIAAEMQARGVPVDEGTFKTHIEELKRYRGVPSRNLRRLYFWLKTKGNAKARRAYRYAKEHREVGRPVAYGSTKANIKVFNPRSHAMVRELFRDLLGAPELRWSERTGEPSYNDKVLSQLIASSDPMISYAVANMTRYRSWDKLAGFLIKKNINGVPVVDGLAHTNWKVYGTRTGRWSSPLMIIPKEGVFSLGKLKNGQEKLVHTPGLRDIFTGFGKNWVVEADYKQLEAVIMALLAGDERWLAIHEAGGKVHFDTARIVFSLPEGAPVSEEQKQVAKRVNYAIQYGVSLDTLWANLNAMGFHCSLADAARIMVAVQGQHPAMMAYQARALSEAYRNDYVEEPLSGLRYYFNGKVKPQEVYNNPVQMLGAVLIKRAIVGVRAELRWPKEGILFQNHDALIVDGPNPDRLEKILVKHMTQTITLGGYTTTFTVDVKRGRNWGSLT